MSGKLAVTSARQTNKTKKEMLKCVECRLLYNSDYYWWLLIDRSFWQFSYSVVCLKRLLVSISVQSCWKSVFFEDVWGSWLCSLLECFFTLNYALTMEQKDRTRHIFQWGKLHAAKEKSASTVWEILGAFIPDYKRFWDTDSQQVFTSKTYTLPLLLSHIAKLKWRYSCRLPACWNPCVTQNGNITSRRWTQRNSLNGWLTAAGVHVSGEKLHNTWYLFAAFCTFLSIICSFFCTLCISYVC